MPRWGGTKCGTVKKFFESGIRDAATEFGVGKVAKKVLDPMSKVGAAHTIFVEIPACYLCN